MAFRGVAARGARSCSTAVASLLQDSDHTRQLERACGISHRMVGHPVVRGEALSAAYDQVMHEITADGKDAKLAFTPSYSDSKQYSPKPYEVARMREKAEKEGDGLHLHFNLYTEGIGTHTAIKRMAEHIGVPMDAFGVAALKDSFCVSTQRASVRGCTWRQLSLMNDMFELQQDLKVGDFEYRTTGVAVGELLGNRCDFAVRHVRGVPLDDLASRIRRVRQHGFVNYHGYQKFSFADGQPYHVALAMLKRDWRGGVEALLRAHPSTAPAADYLHNSGPHGPEDLDVPPSCVRQHAAISGLRSHGDPRRALLTALSRPTRAYCLSSLQGYVWNRMASRRLAQHGYTVQRGDLVLVDRAAADAESKRDTTRLHVVKTDAEARQFVLGDVCLPALGVYRDPESGRPIPIPFPELEGVDRKAHEELLRDELGITLDTFESAVGEAALFMGQVRHVWADCSTLQCFAVPPARPDGDTTPILVTDNMVMERTHFTLRTIPVVATPAAVEAVPGHVLENAAAEPLHDPTRGGYHMILSMLLPASVYPHMLLREILPDLALRVAPVGDTLL